jgi:ABC1 atypical kinase-like domain
MVETKKRPQTTATVTEAPRPPHESSSAKHRTTINGDDSLNPEAFAGLMEEINSRIANGTEDLLQSLNMGLGEKKLRVPEQSAEEFMAYLSDLAENIRQAQEDELNRQLAEFDRKFREPLESLAFSDVPVYNKRPNSRSSPGELTTVPSRDDLILMGKNSTLEKTRQMRSREIMKNWNVAPFYYSVALMIRWARKASYSSIYLLSAFKWLGSAFKSNSKGKQTRSTKRNKISTGDELQAGWKSTGEIAAKGPIARRWAILRRSMEIWFYFSSFYLKDRRITAKYSAGKWTDEKYKAERSRLGVEITQNLLKLGPTFIKVGQLFSTRLDIVPKEYIEQLKELQDNVPGFSGKTAIRIIESELGKPITELFDEFSEKPLAAASLGQVHVAKKGDLVMAIKVQRQFLRELFEVDLGQLRQVAMFADALDVTAEGGLLDKNTQRDWLSVFEENKRLLYEEIDYLNELKNAQRFRKNFDTVKFRHIRVPKVYPEYTTDKVLAMEYVPGIKITNKEAIQKIGLDPVEISVKFAEAFLEQLCRHGFVSLIDIFWAPISEGS